MAGAICSFDLNFREKLWNLWGEQAKAAEVNGSSGGSHPTPQRVSGDVAEVAAGMYFTCGRKTDCTLRCWGINEFGQLGDGTTSTSKPSPVQVTLRGP
jgi:alpha-tubulin suppressor-like RCC1 family protein